MIQVRPILSRILVGRDDLLELADRRIAEAAAGHGQSLLLRGEAGVGKTRLLRVILRKADDAGFRLAKSDLAPQDRQVPLSSILDLGRTMRRLPVFGSLGDELLDTERDRGADTLGSRRLLVHDIADRIVDAIDRPTLLAFEDLQWADEISLEVIGEVARVARDRPLMVVATYRADELPPDTIHREWRARLLSQRLGEEVGLAPLTYDQTALVTTLILDTGLPAPREVVRAVYERTDGIPLHIEELLGALGTEARHDGGAIRDAQVPDTIEDAILARVSRLSPDAQAVARAGAVIGRCFMPDVLAGIMDRPVDDLEPALEELVAGAVLHGFSLVDEGYYDFRHQLLRDALYRSVPVAALRRLHARAAEFGARLDGASEIHASAHFERAGLRAEAYRAALVGARAAAAVSSRREAFELYQRAVANVPAGLPAEELARLYDGYLAAASAIDNIPEAEAAAERARACYLEAGESLEAAMMLLWRAGLARREARPVEGRLATVEQARMQLEALPTSRERDLGLADCLLMRAVNELDLLRIDDAGATIAEARAIAETARDPELVADAEYWQGAVDIIAGRVGPGLDATLRVAREARDRGFESSGVTAYRNAAVLAARVMDYPAATIGVAEGIRYADEIEQSYCRHMMAATSALVAWAEGRWDEAIVVAGQELAEPASRRGGLGARDALGYVAMGRRDVDRARQLLDDSLAAGRVSGEVALVLSPLWGLAEAALVAGDPERASDHCAEGLELAVASGERSLFVPFVVTGTRAQLAARRPDAATRWLERCRSHLAGWDAPAAPALDQAAGLVRLAAGSTVMARAHLEAAVRGWDRLGRTWEGAWARLDLASCLVRGHRHADAIPVLEEARATARRLASPPLLDRVEELMGLARRRANVEEPWRPLTAREFEVGRLVAEGMTNAEIAEALGLSPKTVSAHVEHILAKLGVMRRAEIAAWVASIRLPAVAAKADQVAGAAATSR